MLSTDIAMFFGLMAVAGGLTVCFMIWRTIIFGLTGAMFWIFAGVFMYDAISAAASDMWYLMGIFLIIVGMFLAWEVFTDVRVERRETRESYMAESLESLQDDYTDALDNDDYRRADKIRKRIEGIKAKTAMFNENVEAPQDTIRDKVRLKQERRYWNRFDREGRL